MNIDIHRIKNVVVSDIVKRKLISDDKVYYTRDLRINTGSDIVNLTLYADKAAKLEIVVKESGSDNKYARAMGAILGD